jgi:hypothetical protein
MGQAMLGIDHQSGQWTRTEPGRDPGVFGRQREISFQGQNREAIYGWADRTLRPQRYQALGGAGLGSRVRGQDDWAEPGAGDEADQAVSAGRAGAAEGVSAAADVELLAQVDEAHESLSGPATQKVLQRELYDYGDQRYERPAGSAISTARRKRKATRSPPRRRYPG